MSRMNEKEKSQRAAEAAQETRREMVMTVTLPRLPKIYGGGPVGYDYKSGILHVDGVEISRKVR